MATLSPYVVARHGIYWEFPTAATRLAYSGVEAEVGKIGWQRDDDSLWLLRSTPNIWIPLSGSVVNITETQLDLGGLPRRSGMCEIADPRFTRNSKAIISLSRNAEQFGGICFAAIGDRGKAKVSWSSGSLCRGVIDVNYIIG